MLMKKYYAYCTRITSEIRLRLPAATPADTGPNLHIRRARVPKTLKESDDRIVRHMDGVFSFSIEAGQEITVDPAPNADIDFMRSIIQGELVAAALRQRGLLVLHASCVANDQGAVAFVGLPGWGKTTLATHFLQRDFRLLTDDVLPICTEPGVSKAVPAHPGARLRREVGRELYDNFDDFEDIHERTTKKRVDLSEHFTKEKKDLKKIYVLEGEFKSGNRIKNIKKSNQIFEIMRHTWANHLLSSPRSRSSHLKRAKTIVTNTNVSVLERKKSIDRIEQLITLLENDLS